MTGLDEISRSIGRLLAIAALAAIAACTPLPCAGVIGERTITETKLNADGTWVESVRTVRMCFAE
jgi:hypothetical protein